MSMTAAVHSAEVAGNGPLERLRRWFRPVRWFRRRMLRKPASTLALSVGTLLTGVIVMNALALQTERHPAPMFTSLIEERPVAPAPNVVPPPAPRPDAADRKRDVAPRDARAQPQQTQQRDESGKSSTVSKEQMLAVIRGGAPDANVDQTSRVLQVQRALNRAGFGPLKEDGVLGPGTKQALEKFEAARKLPVKGEPQGRTLRELARQSGVAID